jgi:hypothetical protein
MAVEKTYIILAWKFLIEENGMTILKISMKNLLWGREIQYIQMCLHRVKCLTYMLAVSKPQYVKSEKLVSLVFF